METCQRCGEPFEVDEVKIPIGGNVIGSARNLNCPKCENEYTEADSKTGSYQFSVDRVAAVYEAWRELTEARVGHELPNIGTFDSSNDSTVMGT